jgi:hypothetical protein
MPSRRFFLANEIAANHFAHGAAVATATATAIANFLFGP